MKLSMTKITSALFAMAFGLTVQSALAQDSQEPLSRELLEDTVLCMKNTSDEPIVAIIWEGYITAAGTTRKVALEADKTACLRYRDAYRIKADFYFVSDGKFKPLYFRGVCSRLKNGMARFYLLSRSENGHKKCVEDKTRNKDSIRRLVADANPFRP